MIFYAINPSHPHLGASISLRLYPLAAAEEAGFAEVAQAYVFYGDGAWERGHKLFKREGAFWYKIPQYNGAKLYLRFFLVDSEGRGSFVNGMEHPIAYGQYAELFEENDAQPADVGGLICLEDSQEVLSLAEKLGSMVRQGAESLWLKLPARILTEPESQGQLIQVLEAVRGHRLPGTYLEVVCDPEIQAQEIMEGLAQVQILQKRWLKAVFLSSDEPKRAMGLLSSLGETVSGQILALVSPEEYLEDQLRSDPKAVPAYLGRSQLDLALLRGAVAEESGLIWAFSEGDEIGPAWNRFHREFAVATGVGHFFTTSFTQTNSSLFAVRPLLPDLTLVVPEAWLTFSELPWGGNLQDLVSALEEAGYLVSLTLAGGRWKARGAMFLDYAPVVGEEASNGRHPVLVLPSAGWSPQEGEKLPGGWVLKEWPESIQDLLAMVNNWFTSTVEEMSSWVVVPGK